jgi:hypothetical protein
MNKITERVNEFINKFPIDKVHLSFTALRKFDPAQGGTPRNFCFHYTQETTNELDANQGLIEYLLLGEEEFANRYVLVNDLTTKIGKEQKEQSVEQKKKWIRKKDVLAFQDIYDGLELLPQFQDCMADCDITKCLFQNFVIDYTKPGFEPIQFKARRFVHFLKLKDYSADITILKRGNYENASSYAIRNAGIPLQAALHSWGYEDKEITVKVITFNDRGDTCVYNLSKETIEEGVHKTYGLIGKLVELYENPDLFSLSHNSNEYNGEWTI